MREVRGGHLGDVLIGRGLLERLDEWVTRQGLAPQGPVFLLVDQALPASLLDVAVTALRRRWGVIEARMEAVEEGKSLSTLGDILVQMARGRVERGGLLVALGGGVVTDLGGFAAAVYKRGIALAHAPTTLLAMVDAAIGGKTGVNLDLGGGEGLEKNVVGAFHAPAVTVADTRALKSLPRRQFVAGLAECVKHALLGSHGGDPWLLDWLEGRVGEVLTGQEEAIEELIERNVRVKVAITTPDPREEAPDTGRALLNLGHTFGHVIETLTGLEVNGQKRALSHGEAVGLGMVAACATARAMGLCPPGLCDRVRDLLERIGLPVVVGGLPPDDLLLARMGRDKKVRGGRLRLVLPVGEGSCRVVESPPAEAVTTGLRAIRAVTA